MIEPAATNTMPDEKSKLMEVAEKMIEDYKKDDNNGSKAHSQFAGGSYNSSPKSKLAMLSPILNRKN